jgi:putative transposase
MCRVLRASRSGFYAWLHKPLSDRAIEDQRLLPLIRASYVASGGVYGSPRVFLDLRETGETCGKHRVARIMSENKIKAIRGYKAPRVIAGRNGLLFALSPSNRRSSSDSVRSGDRPERVDCGPPNSSFE